MNLTLEQAWVVLDTFMWALFAFACTLALTGHPLSGSPLFLAALVINCCRERAFR